MIECLLNQNARDNGAAQTAAVAPGLLAILRDAELGMAQIPCPEMACLGHRRDRLPGQTIRDALETPQAGACCTQQAEATAQRIQDYRRAGIEVVAVLGGNERSPACAVHCRGDSDQGLLSHSGVFMLALADALTKRQLRVPFIGLRDADPRLLAEDLERLQHLL